jgi:DNA-binding MarR family transcriptional regulator
VSAEPQPPDYAIGLLLARAQRRAADTFNRELVPLGIQGKHFGVLMTLARRDSVSQRQLADQLSNDKTWMVRMIDDLEQRGLVVRAADPSDRRAFAITMTPAGRQTFQAARKVAERVTDQLLSGFAANERQELIRLLARFAEPEPDEPTPPRSGPSGQRSA